VVASAPAKELTVIEVALLRMMVRLGSGSAAAFDGWTSDSLAVVPWAAPVWAGGVVGSGVVVSAGGVTAEGDAASDASLASDVGWVGDVTASLEDGGVA
jgi:hypothetical protein